MSETKKSRKKPPEEHKPTGRPSTYNPDIARQMCEMLADGIPLREICRKEGFPMWQRVYDWMYRDAELAGAIARAREVGQDAIAEEIYRLVEQPPAYIEDERGSRRVDSGHVQWVKMQADIKLKLLAKWNPKRYGDRTTLAGDEENPLVIQANTAVFKELLTNLKLRRQSGE